MFLFSLWFYETFWSLSLGAILFEICGTLNYSLSNFVIHDTVGIDEQQRQNISIQAEFLALPFHPFALCSRGFFNYPDRIFFLFFSLVPLDFPTLTSPIFKLGWLRQGRGRRQKGGYRLSIHIQFYPIAPPNISARARKFASRESLRMREHAPLVSCGIYVYQQEVFRI